MAKGSHYDSGIPRPQNFSDDDLDEFFPPYPVVGLLEDDDSENSERNTQNAENN